MSSKQPIIMRLTDDDPFLASDGRSSSDSSAYAFTLQAITCACFTETFPLVQALKPDYFLNALFYRCCCFVCLFVCLFLQHNQALIVIYRIVEER